MFLQEYEILSELLTNAVDNIFPRETIYKMSQLSVNNRETRLRRSQHNGLE